MVVREEKIMLCKRCNGMIAHQRNASRINWVMHLCLMIVFGLGFITLTCAIIFQIIRQPIFFGETASNTSWFCTKCGNTQ